MLFGKPNHAYIPVVTKALSAKAGLSCQSPSYCHALFLAESAIGGARKRLQLRHTPKQVESCRCLNRKFGYSFPRHDIISKNEGFVKLNPRKTHIEPQILKNLLIFSRLCIKINMNFVC